MLSASGPNGEKMSKTKGNVIDPLDVTKEHGADALRMTLAALAAQARDVKLSHDRLAFSPLNRRFHVVVGRHGRGHDRGHGGVTTLGHLFHLSDGRRVYGRAGRGPGYYYRWRRAAPRLLAHGRRREVERRAAGHRGAARVRLYC